MVGAGSEMRWSEEELRLDFEREGEVCRRRLYVTDAQSDVSGAGLRSCEPLRVWRQAAVCAMRTGNPSGRAGGDT